MPTRKGLRIRITLYDIQQVYTESELVAVLEGASRFGERECSKVVVLG